MSYSTALPGVDEARLDALQAMIIASLTDLNAALARDALTPMTWTSAQVLLGDPASLAGSAICIVGGGEQDARDLEASEEFVNNGEGWGERLSTNIYVYLHADEMTSDSPSAIVHAARLERARSRICDHLRKRVFNTASGMTITLASREHSVAPDYDKLQDCHVTDVSKGVVSKGYGQASDYVSAHLLHTGFIA